MFGVSCWWLSIEWSEYTTYKGMESWPRTTGNIKNISIIENEWTDYSDRKKRDFSLELNYEFEANGKTYIGSDYCRKAVTWPTIIELKSEIARHMRDSESEVAYHPDKPEISFAILSDKSLDRRLDSPWDWLLMPGFMVLVCGVMLLGAIFSPTG